MDELELSLTTGQWVYAHSQTTRRAGMTGSRRADKPGSDGDEPAEQFVTFTQGASAAEVGVSAIEPTRAADFAGETFEDDFREDGLLQYLYQENVYVYDAIVAGWVVFSPVEFSVRDSSGDPTELVREAPCPEEVLRFDTDGSTIHLDTLWQVRFPVGFEGLIIPPIATEELPVEVVPRTVGGSQDESAVAISLSVRGDGTIERGQSIGQIIPTNRSGPTVGYRHASEAETADVQKEVRRQQLYPRVYSEERPSPRFGTLERIGSPEREE